MKTVTSFLSVLFLVVLTSSNSQAAAVCGSAGAFVSDGACCQGLVKDTNNRCQFPTCKKEGQTAVVQSNGISDCCFGLTSVSGVCKKPTLIAKCSLLGQVAGSKPCCKGLTKDAATGKCSRNSVSQCSSTQIATCCHGPADNTCACYCPSPYYIGQ